MNAAEWQSLAHGKFGNPPTGTGNDDSECALSDQHAGALAADIATGLAGSRCSRLRTDSAARAHLGAPRRDRRVMPDAGKIVAALQRGLGELGQSQLSAAGAHAGAGVIEAETTGVGLLGVAAQTTARADPADADRGGLPGEGHGRDGAAGDR